MEAQSLAFRLSRGVLSTIKPPIPEAYRWSSRYQSTPNRPLLDMSQGVPSNPPPLSLQNSLRNLPAATPFYRYGPVEGEAVLRYALAEEMRSVYGQAADVNGEDVALTAGCNMAFVAVIMCLADAGDEVILPVPWYFNHQMTLSLLGIQTVALKTSSETAFLPSVEICRKLITPKTKAIALVTPNNPTGAIYPPALLLEFSSLAMENNIALVVDETYRDFIPPTSPHVPTIPHGLFTTSWRSHLIHLFSFSKSYAIPALRLGAVVASPEFISHMKTTLDCLQICAPRPPQIALAPLLPDLRQTLTEASSLIARRHAALKRELPEGWAIGSQGGYFAFVKHPLKELSTHQVAERLATDFGVIVLPGNFFGEEQSPWIRFSVAGLDEAGISQACGRLREFTTRMLG